MAQEKKEEKKAEPIGFLQKLGQLGYPLADVAGKMAEIEREDKSCRTFAFSDANGRKEIAITATREQWRAWFEEALKS